METQHPEDGPSPFVAQDDASIAALISLQEEQDVEYISCPVEGCGEALLLTELDNHVEMHEEEENHSPRDSSESSRSAKRLKTTPQTEASFDTKLSYALRNLDNDDDGHLAHEKSSHDRQTAAKNTWKSILKMPDQPASKVASKSTPIANSGKKRLGVSTPFLPPSQSHVYLNLSRNPNLVLMPMRSKCQDGWSNCLKKKMVP